MINNKRIDKIEIIVFFLLLSSATLMVLFTSHAYSLKIMIGVVLTSPALLYVIKKREKFDKSIAVKLVLAAQFVIGIFYGISAIKYTQIGYSLIAFSFLFIIPLLQVFFYNREDSIVYRMSIASAAFIIFFTVISFLFGRPITTEQFGGILHNQNELGVLCTTIMPAGLLLMRSGKKGLGIAIAAITTSLAIFSCSRTAFIAMFAQIAFMLVIALIELKRKRYTLKGFLKLVAIFVIVCIVVYFVMFWMFTTAKLAVSKIIPTFQLHGSYDEYLDMDDLTEKLEGRATQGLGDEEYLNYNFSSGRWGIWMDYIDNIRLTGHRKEERDRVYSGTRFYASTNAHNACLQVAYGAGLPAGIGLLVITVMSAIGCLLQFYYILKGNAISEKIIYVIMIVLGFGAVTITSSSWMVFVHLPAVFFWPMVTNLFVRTKNKKDEQ